MKRDYDNIIYELSEKKLHYCISCLAERDRQNKAYGHNYSVVRYYDYTDCKLLYMFELYIEDGKMLRMPRMIWLKWLTMQEFALACNNGDIVEYKGSN